MTSYRELWRQARAGGFTVNLAGETPEHGYVVSYPDCERRIDVRTFRPRHIRAFVKDYARLLARPNHYLGAWRDDDVIVLDVSAVIVSHDDALRAEHYACQDALYDLDRHLIERASDVSVSAAS